MDMITRGHSSFSGADIKAVFGAKEVGTLMAVSYAIQREKAPIYVLGEANPLGFSRGKRGIAGSLIFIQLSDHPLLGADVGEKNRFAQKVYENSPIDIDTNGLNPNIEGARKVGELNLGGQMAKVATPFYADQILPFDISISAVNELGITARCIIHGVEIMNEGWGMGIEDKQSDMQSTYLARAVTRWKATPEENVGKLAKSGSQLTLE